MSKLHEWLSIIRSTYVNIQYLPVVFINYTVVQTEVQWNFKANFWSLLRNFLPISERQKLAITNLPYNTSTCKIGDVHVSVHRDIKRRQLFYPSTNIQRIHYEWRRFKHKLRGECRGRKSRGRDYRSFQFVSLLCGELLCHDVMTPHEPCLDDVVAIILCF